MENRDANFNIMLATDSYKVTGTAGASGRGEIPGGGEWLMDGNG